ncbi:MAG TPA: arsenate reductase [Micromonosporaceae bacterium]|nr:arsenate reductase [Micromonosporaceae bacterium]HCU52107.1 arsenate reductase [Micromonosporaceae bacterium]
MTEMWHNPSCSKCAAAVETLGQANIELALRPYLEQSPNADELNEVLSRLRMQPWELCRMGEPAAASMADWPRDESARERWIAAMVEHPELIQRPILLLADGSAMVARSPEALVEAVRRSREQ